MDAFLSLALTIVCMIASPILATVGMPRAFRSMIGLTAIICAILLAAFGAITAALLMLRMSAGQYLLPLNLRLPLPPSMRPTQLTPDEDPSAMHPTS